MKHQREQNENSIQGKSNCRATNSRATSTLKKRGAVAKFLVFFLLSALIAIALGYSALMLRPDARRNVSSQPIVRVYCSSGVAKPVEQLIKSYNEQFGARIEMARTGGSGELAGQIKTEFEAGVTAGADLYITSDDQLLNNAHAEGIVTDRFPLAKQKPVIAISSGSRLTIDTLQDLVEQPNVKFGIASRRAAIGKMTRQIALRDGVLEELESKKATDSENVMTLAQALVTGSLDAAIVWDTTITQINQQYPPGSPALKIAAFADPLNEFQSTIAIGVVSTTHVPTECLRFARYLTAPETGKATFEGFGFSFIDVVPGFDRRRHRR